jgi:hypothetical protein
VLHLDRTQMPIWQRCGKLRDGAFYQSQVLLVSACPRSTPSSRSLHCCCCPSPGPPDRPSRSPDAPFSFAPRARSISPDLAVPGSCREREVAERGKHLWMIDRLLQMRRWSWC